MNITPQVQAIRQDIEDITPQVQVVSGDIEDINSKLSDISSSSAIVAPTPDNEEARSNLITNITKNTVDTVQNYITNITNQLSTRVDKVESDIKDSGTISAPNSTQNTLNIVRNYISNVTSQLSTRVDRIESAVGGGGALVRTGTDGDRNSLSNSTLGIIQSLQYNYQQGLQKVVVRVEDNSDNISSLYDQYSEDKKLELQAEKVETRDLFKSRQRTLANLREKLVEGMGSAAAAIQSGLASGAKKINNAVGGFLSKLGKFFGLLGLAWLVDNIDSVVAAFSQFPTSLDELGRAVIDGLANFTRIGGLINFLADGIVTGVSRIIKTILSSVGWVIDSIKKLIGGVFDIVKSGLRRLGRLLGLIPDPKPKIKPPAPDSAPGVSGNSSGSGASAGSGAGAGAGAAGGAAEDARPRGLGARISEGLAKLNPFKDSKEITKEAADAAALSPAASPSNTASRLSKYIDDFLGPFLKSLPSGAAKTAKGIIRTTAFTLSKLPIIGIGIDYILNSLEGVPWKENLIRSIASGVTGDVGAAGGAAIGFGLGLPFGGVGSIPGAFIGAIIGGIGGGMLGDQVGKSVVSGLGMKTTETSTDSLVNLLTGKGNDSKDNKSVTPATPTTKTGDSSNISSPTTLTEILDPNRKSTPDGLGFPTGENTNTITNIDLGTDIIDNTPKNSFVESLDKDRNRMESDVEFNPVPSILSNDPESNVYRSLSYQVYDLVTPSY